MRTQYETGALRVGECADICYVKLYGKVCKCLKRVGNAEGIEASMAGARGFELTGSAGQELPHNDWQEAGAS
jgi:hypothetical protein